MHLTGGVEAGPGRPGEPSRRPERPRRGQPRAAHLRRDRPRLPLPHLRLRPPALQRDPLEQRREASRDPGVLRRGGRHEPFDPLARQPPGEEARYLELARLLVVSAAKGEPGGRRDDDPRRNADLLTGGRRHHQIEARVREAGPEPRLERGDELSRHIEGERVVAGRRPARAEQPERQRNRPRAGGGQRRWRDHLERAGRESEQVGRDRRGGREPDALQLAGQRLLRQRRSARDREGVGADLERHLERRLQRGVVEAGEDSPRLSGSEPGERVALPARPAAGQPGAALDEGAVEVDAHGRAPGRNGAPHRQPGHALGVRRRHHRLPGRSGHLDRGVTDREIARVEPEPRERARELDLDGDGALEAFAFRQERQVERVPQRTDVGRQRQLGRGFPAAGRRRRRPHAGQGEDEGGCERERAHVSVSVAEQPAGGPW